MSRLQIGIDKMTKEYSGQDSQRGEVRSTGEVGLPLREEDYLGTPQKREVYIQTKLGAQFT